jgi:DNA-binding transcriptional regulator YiaG
MECKIHDCEEVAVERTATPDSPYHYVNSGLPNVYLSGVKYRVCEECKKQEADIPALKQLLESIARALVEKHSKLIGPEIRFLRKRLQKKQMEFAGLLSLTPQRLSTLENSPKPEMEEVREKFLRTVYPIFSEDAKLRQNLDDRDGYERWMASISQSDEGERIVATWNRRHWRVSTEPTMAA